MACCRRMVNEKGSTVANRAFATASWRCLRGTGLFGVLAALVLALGFPSATGAARTSNDARTAAVTVSAAAVSASGSHTCGLRSDATIACWGDNSEGQA